MDTKLILKLDKQVIEAAKRYASYQKRSLSELIEAYLRTLVDKENVNAETEIEISPFVKSLRTGVKIPMNIDIKDEYRNYLAEKHK
nr:hypothetical protein [Cytophagales bacterium]